MDQAIYDFYSKPVTNPLYWYVKSMLGRMARFTIPIAANFLQETLHDYFVEQLPFTEALLSNVKQIVEKTINNCESSSINKPTQRSFSTTEDDWSPERTIDI